MSRKAEVDQAVSDVDFSAKRYQVLLKTSAGDILLDLHGDNAPGHCKNLIGLSRIGYYDGLGFHRIIDGFMIQGGCPEGTGTGGPGYNIDAEFNETPHEIGVLSMARTSDPNSAGSQFFICLGTHAYLDGQYTAFGSCADESSVETVRKIGDVATDPGDRPLEPVGIVSVEVIELDK